MSRIIILLLILNNLLSADAHTARENAQKAVFRVININPQQSGTGTGFVINKKGHLITNYHVIEGYVKDGLQVQNVFYESVSVKVIKAYPKKDLAILQITNYDKKHYVKLQDPNTLRESDKAYAFGYPGAADIVGQIGSQGSTIATMTEGIISRFNKTALNSTTFPPSYNLIQTNSAISGGNSGGPLLSAIGTVMGVNTWGPKGPSQGIFWAINIREVMTILKENRIKYYTNKSDPTGEKTTFITYVFYVISALLFLIIIFTLIKLGKRKDPSIDEKELSKLIRKKMGEMEDNSDVSTNDDNYDNAFICEEIVEMVPENTHTQIIPPEGHSVYIQDYHLYPKDTSLPMLKLETGDSLTIGRAKECDIVISRDAVSKQHLKITAIPGGIEVEDLGSTNGTYIENKRINAHSMHLLEAGKKLTIGSEDITYIYKG